MERKNLNFEDPEIYRELGKPIGSLNPKRLTFFKERYESMPEGEKFFYGTHYSSPGYVIGY